jgi:malate synthase
LAKRRDDVMIGKADLLAVHEGTRTDHGLRENIRVGVQYMEAWLRGRGAVPIYHLMEDAATAEISRAQIWQFVNYGVTLEDGTIVTRPYFERVFDEEMAQVKREVGDKAFDSGRFPEAVALFKSLSLAESFEEFLTLPAYSLLG